VETQAYFIGREEMLRVLEGSPQLAVRLVREFSLRLRDFNHRYTEEVLQAERLALVGRFARSIVHDFKNPLNIIGISAEMAALAEATPEQRESARNRIRKQVDRMSNMINELMEFTRGSTSTTVLARADFAEFVRPLLEEIRQEVGAKRVTVELASDPPAVRLLMDPRRLAHVFFNIVNNACDAMPEGGRVIVRFASNDQEVVTEIEDTGPGIAREMASRLFQPFATHGKAQGTGLGLSICRRIIEDHHGQIRACNAESGGARFTFSLPLRLESAVKV
jgi:signal transduction histidine kinase